MKRFRIGAVIAVALFAGMFACGGGGDGGGGGGGGNPPVQQVSGGTVTGTVSDQAGAKLANVSVKAGTGASAPTTLSNEQGFFALVGVPAGNAVLNYELAGYVDNKKAATVTDGRNTQVTLTLQNVGTSQQVDTTQPATVTHRGGKVDLPANGVVNSSGQPVANATVDVTTLIPGDPNYVEAFPGEFFGTDGGNRTPLISFGVVDVSMKDGGGNALQLGQGQQANVEFPIPPAAFDSGDATIPLWYLDPGTAEWIREGTATRDANAGVYRGTVTHFSSWNLDKGPIDSWKRIRLLVNGVPVVGASVRVDGGVWLAGGTTDENGEALLQVPAGRSGTVRMLRSDGTWIVLRQSEMMAGSNETKLNVYTEADGVVQQIITAILEWGERPTDLDAHMTVPTPQAREHVYFGRKGDLENSPWCALNTDDRSSFGPEIITVTRALTGTYRYVVHNYSTNGQHAITESEARVTLISRFRPTEVFTVPASNPANENYWAVFDLVFDAAGNMTVQRLDQIGNLDVLMR